MCVKTCSLPLPHEKQHWHGSWVVARQGFPPLVGPSFPACRRYAHPQPIQCGATFEHPDISQVAFHCKVEFGVSFPESADSQVHEVPFGSNKSRGRFGIGAGAVEVTAGTDATYSTTGCCHVFSHWRKAIPETKPHCLTVQDLSKLNKTVHISCRGVEGTDDDTSEATVRGVGACQKDDCKRITVLWRCISTAARCACQQRSLTVRYSVIFLNA